ncbi:MAG: hypothetical protein WC655_25755, partial [Candidatus Hydrogenedentales bacterium]
TTLRALVNHGLPREGAKEVYLDILRNQPREYDPFLALDSCRAVSLCGRFGWKEVIPLLEKMKLHPATPGLYVACCQAIRLINGRPMPGAVIKAWNVRNAAQRQALLLASDDPEAVMWEAIHLATLRIKGDTEHEKHMAVDMLRTLPKDFALPVLRDLALNLQDSYDREAVQKVLIEVQQ